MIIILLKSVKRMKFGGERFESILNVIYEDLK